MGGRRCASKQNGIWALTLKQLWLAFDRLEAGGDFALLYLHALFGIYQGNLGKSSKYGLSPSSIAFGLACWSFSQCETQRLPNGREKPKPERCFRNTLWLERLRRRMVQVVQELLATPLPASVRPFWIEVPAAIRQSILKQPKSPK